MPSSEAPAHPVLAKLKVRLTESVRADHPDKSAFWHASAFNIARALVALSPSLKEDELVSVLCSVEKLKATFEAALKSPNTDAVDFGMSFLTGLSAGGRWRVVLNLAGALDQPLPAETC